MDPRFDELLSDPRFQDMVCPVDASGQSKISVQDYGVAMIDELERLTHVRQRFTVEY